MRARTHIESSDINFATDNVLFVEGTQESLDVIVLTALLNGIVKVSPIGNSSTLKQSAKAFANSNPNYYFIVDRDYSTVAQVDENWRNFENDASENFLMWRKKEIENYFLDPSFLRRSQYYNGENDDNQLKQKIVCESKKYLFLTAANLSIVEIRQEFHDWVSVYDNSALNDFNEYNIGLTNLLNNLDFSSFSEKVATTFDTQKLQIKALYEKYVRELTGLTDSNGNYLLSWGHGTWLDRISGKEVLQSVLQTNIFRIPNGTQQSEKTNAIIQDLIISERTQLPEDFIKLKELLKKKVLEKEERIRS